MLELLPEWLIFSLKNEFAFLLICNKADYTAVIPRLNKGESVEKVREDIQAQSPHQLL